MEHLDQTQLDFNALVHYIEILECAPPSGWSSLGYALGGFNEVMKSVVDRFHPGLILFVLKKIEKWSTRERYQELYSKIGGELRKCINLEENIKNIASAFYFEQKRSLATELLKFVDRKYVPFMIQYMLDERLDLGVKPFAEALLRTDYKIEEEFFLWPEDLQVSCIPLLAEINFSQRGEWLSRAMRNRSGRVRQVAVRYVALAKLDPVQSIGLFERLDSSSQKIWLESLLTNPINESWKPFVSGLIKSGKWTSWPEEISSLFVRLVFKYMGKPAIEVFEPWVSVCFLAKVSK